MDAFITEEAEGLNGEVFYDLEPNPRERDKLLLPRRARFYHALRDARILKSSEGYDKLLSAFVIIITPYDPLNAGRLKYTIKTMVTENTAIPYDDGAVTLLLNTQERVRTNLNPSKTYCGIWQILFLKRLLVTNCS